MMTGSKTLFTSKTFWGAIVTAVISIAGIFGFSTEGIDGTAIATALSVLGTTGVTIYGRITADKSIG